MNTAVVQPENIGAAVPRMTGVGVLIDDSGSIADRVPPNQRRLPA